MDHEHRPDETALAAALRARLDRPVVLVGMMGVGKSSVGRRLAALLGCDFVDADEAIEEAAQLSIPEIFATYGEAMFRDGERRVIARLIDGTGSTPLRVIATGGGAFVNPETRALIATRGIAVWLDASLDTLVERTARRDNRPLLKDGNPREILARLIAERAPAYAEAPIRVTSGQAPQQRTVANVIAALTDYLDRQPAKGPHP
ncbi:MAG: shikimate kinase [Proteobacteria bacterium]|nr:shikimate kinase [Pseudomonadota bacterium]